MAKKKSNNSAVLRRRARRAAAKTIRMERNIYQRDLRVFDPTYKPRYEGPQLPDNITLFGTDKLNKRDRARYGERYGSVEYIVNEQKEALLAQTGGSPSTTHEILTEDAKHQRQPKVAGKVDSEYNRSSKTGKMDVHKEVSDIKKESVVKKKSASTPKVKNPFGKHAKKIGDIFSGRRGFLLQAAAWTGSFLMAKSVVGLGVNKIINSGTQMFDRRSAYLPDSYEEGFNDIKQSLTDFGSRVHLDKTISRVNITPPNSTRNALVTSTKSIMNNNIALKLSNNAINHTRY